MKNIESPPKTIIDGLSGDEIKRLIELSENNPNKEYKNYGNAYVIKDSWRDQEKEILEKKIENWIGNHTVKGTYNFYTESPYNIHNDPGNDPNKIPYKIISIPLQIYLPIKTVYTALFSQRFRHYSSELSQNPGGSDYNTHLVDMTKLDPYREKKEFDELIYNQYFTHIDRETLSYLDLEKLLTCIPGNVNIFDCSQYHCSTHFDNVCKGKRMFSIFTDLA